MAHRGDEDEDQIAIRENLDRLKTQHQELNAIIDRFSDTPIANQLQLQRLKREKLLLKDQIVSLENMLLPDIIA